MKVPITVMIPISKTIVPDKNMSWAINALNKSGPSVGKLITIETIMLPETNVGKRYPSVLITGFRATLNGYFKITLHSLSPFARAVTTYGLRSSSNMFARSTLII